MININLIIDSGTNLPESIIEEYNIKKVNLNVTFGEENFIEKDCKDFYKKMANSSILPKTSAPAPDKYIDYFQDNLHNIVLSFSSKLSATYTSAKLAKDIYLENHKNIIIEVVDTLNGCVGSGLLTIFVAELIKNGKDIDYIIGEINKRKSSIFQIGVLETLDNAIKGGRISKSKALIANALNIKPIVEIIDGEVKVTDKVRGVKGGLKKIAEKIINLKEANTNYSMLGIAHGDNLNRALYLRDMILEKTNFNKIIITEIGPVLGTYAAEGAILTSIF